MPVNGVSYDHESLVMEVPGIGQALTLAEVSYTPKKGAEVKTDSTGVPNRLVRKKFEGDFNATVARSEFNALLESTVGSHIKSLERQAICSD